MAVWLRGLSGILTLFLSLSLSLSLFLSLSFPVLSRFAIVLVGFPTLLWPPLDKIGISVLDWARKNQKFICYICKSQRYQDKDWNQSYNWPNFLVVSALRMSTHPIEWQNGTGARSSFSVLATTATLSISGPWAASWWSCWPAVCFSRVQQRQV